MKNNFTLPVTKEKQNTAKNKNEEMLSPSEKTLTFLKLFARNYQVEKILPEGIQEIVLG